MSYDNEQWIAKSSSFTAVSGGRYRTTNAAGAWIEVTLPASGEVVINRIGAGAVVVWGSTTIDGSVVSTLAFPRGETRLSHDGSGWRSSRPNEVRWLLTSGLSVLCVADKGLGLSGSNITSWTDQIGGRVYTPAAGTPTYSATGLGNHPSVSLPSGAYMTATLLGGAGDTINTYFAAAWAGSCANPATSRRTIWSKSNTTQGVTIGWMSGAPGYSRNNSNSSGTALSTEKVAAGFSRVNNLASTIHHIFSTGNLIVSDSSAISTFADAGTDTRIGADSAAANPYGDTPLYGFAFWTGSGTTLTMSQLRAAVGWFELVGTD